jgi:hypothetical protein
MAIVLSSATAGATLATWDCGDDASIDAAWIHSWAVNQGENGRCWTDVPVHIKLAAKGLNRAESRARLLSTATWQVHLSSQSYRDWYGREPDVSAVFSGLESHVRDDRARWLRVQFSKCVAKRSAEILARDPEIEQAFIEPETTLPDRFQPGLDAPIDNRGHRVVGGRHYADVGDQMPMWIEVDHGAIDLDRMIAVPTRDDGESCPIHTPSFESYQGYLGPAPGGIDAPAAWRRGFRGQGVWFADIEGGWNAKHEDLPGDRITHVAGEEIKDPSWRAHGTAVLGEVVGRDNGKGVVGIAPDVERVFTSSIGGIAVADAIDKAARALRAGDVLLIELQRTGPRGRFLPVEYWDDVYDAIYAATQRGVVVIEAAGNGNEDLDHKEYKGKLDRKKRDSGAIMIGAGAPLREGFRDREKLDFSNYGSRVDVQGWGRKVATLDYGDLQSCEDEQQDWRYTDRHYTGEFSGTSSASPIVAGAAVILQGIARSRGAVIPPIELRELLRRTGTPQAGDTAKHIGPRPDLARAIVGMSLESNDWRSLVACDVSDASQCP